jgi:RNA-directed DNA polymerase
VLSNILLTPFDWEMRVRGYQLARYADDWVVTCTSEAEAAKAIADAERILAQLGVQLHPQKTRIVHINRGFDFLGYTIKRGRPRAALRRKLGRNAPAGTVYAYPSAKSINRFKDQVRQLTKRRIPLATDQIIAEMNPIVRGLGSIL